MIAFTLSGQDYYVVITRWTTGGYDIFITCREAGN